MCVLSDISVCLLLSLCFKTLLAVLVHWRDMCSMLKTSHCCVIWETTTWELSRSGTFLSYRWCWSMVLRALEQAGAPKFPTMMCEKSWAIWDVFWMASNQVPWYNACSSITGACFQTVHHTISLSSLCILLPATWWPCRIVVPLCFCVCIMTFEWNDFLSWYFGVVV